jgi:hypothetical protein
LRVKICCKSGNFGKKQVKGEPNDYIFKIRALGQACIHDEIRGRYHMEMLIILVIIGIIGYIIYNYKKTNKSSVSEQGGRRGEAVDYNDFDEVVDGYEFCVTFWPYTPLETLKHHGEKVRCNSENKLPEYGDSRNGIWLPFFNDDISPPNKVELRELEFLKKFRESYESNLSHERKHEIISALFKEYHDLPEQISRAADWYLWELLEISGVSANIAKVLYSEGIRSKKDVMAASDEELLRIPGIGPGRCKQIRTYFSIPGGVQLRT